MKGQESQVGIHSVQLSGACQSKPFPCLTDTVDGGRLVLQGEHSSLFPCFWGNFPSTHSRKVYLCRIINLHIEDLKNTAFQKHFSNLQLYFFTPLDLFLFCMKQHT